MNDSKENKVTKKKKKSCVIEFDKEIVTKDDAKQILTKLRQEKDKNNNDGNVANKTNKKGKKRKITENSSVELKNGSVANSNDTSVLQIPKKKKKQNQETTTVNGNGEPVGKKKKKKKKKQNQETAAQIGNGDSVTQKKKQNQQTTVENGDDNPSPKKKKKRNQQTTPNESTTEQNGDNTTTKKPLSKRQIKRERFAKSIREEKLKHALLMQKLSLNYLSKWKHNRSSWKFEKLRQVWLQQNMFDETKIPNEFWGTLIEYFASGIGSKRKQVLNTAMAYIEQDNNENGEDGGSRMKRARDVIQYLHE